jgi:hypothetical protein
MPLTLGLWQIHLQQSILYPSLDPHSSFLLIHYHLNKSVRCLIAALFKMDLNKKTLLM